MDNRRTGEMREDNNDDGQWANNNSITALLIESQHKSIKTHISTTNIRSVDSFDFIFFCVLFALLFSSGAVLVTLSIERIYDVLFYEHFQYFLLTNGYCFDHHHCTALKLLFLFTFVCVLLLVGSASSSSLHRLLFLWWLLPLMLFGVALA